MGSLSEERSAIRAWILWVCVALLMLGLLFLCGIQCGGVVPVESEGEGLEADAGAEGGAEGGAEAVTDARPKPEPEIVAVVPNHDARVPILMYHEVADKTWGLEGLFVKISDFEAQMKYLSDNGYKTLFVSEITRQTNFDKKVVLTFDDAYVGFYDNVLPVLKKYNIKVSLYVISSAFGGNFITEDQLKEIHDSGLVQIGSHSQSHPDLTTLSSAKLEEEIKGSKDALEAMLGTKITTFAYPTGAHNDMVVDMVKLHYKDALITGNSLANINVETDLYTLPRFGMYRTTTLKTFADWCSLGR
ncbi:MAG: polysaccharide deacetylase family protein [Peptococcaceae bacterium]|nr:polysaccharide deacetylase family protein [Peptococcaceae bacterium]